MSTAVGGQAAASSPVFTRGRAVGAQRPGTPPGTPRDGCIEATSGRWRSGVRRGVVHTPEEGLDEGVTWSQADVGGMPVNPPVLRSATITRAQAGIGPCATREGDGVKAAARPRPRTSAREAHARPPFTQGHRARARHSGAAVVDAHASCPMRLARESESQPHKRRRPRDRLGERQSRASNAASLLILACVNEPLQLPHAVQF